MDIIDWFKNASLAVKVITSALILIILLLILSIIGGGKSKKTQVVTNNSGGKDFEEIQIETPTPAPTVVIPTVIPTSKPTLIPTNTPYPTSTPHPTITPTPTPTNSPQSTTRAISTPIPTIYPEILHLSAYQVGLYPGEQQEIKASILPLGVFDNTITWTVEDSNIARIESAKNRLIVTAASPGSTKIIAKTVNDKTAEISVAVKDTAIKSAISASTMISAPTSAPIPTQTVIEPSSIRIDQSTFSLSKNNTAQLTVIYTPIITTRRHLNWSSSNTNIATVDVSGKVTAVNPGNVTITATSVNGRTSRSNITVTDTTSQIIPTPTTSTFVPNDINLNATSIKLYSDEIQKISASVVPTNATDKSLQWSSNNTTVATVNSLGYITAKKPGTAIVTVKTVNNITKSILVEVSSIYATSNLDRVKINKPLSCDLSNKTFATWQCDPAWADKIFDKTCPVGSKGYQATVCNTGCGLESTSTILRAQNPQRTPNWLIDNKFAANTAFCQYRTSWTTIRNALVKYLGKDAVTTQEAFHCTSDQIKKLICSDHVVLVLLGGDSGYGHWVTAVAVTQDGDIVLKDPGFGRETRSVNYLSNALKGDYNKFVRSCLAVKASYIRPKVGDVVIDEPPPGKIVLPKVTIGNVSRQDLVNTAMSLKGKVWYCSVSAKCGWYNQIGVNRRWSKTEIFKGVDDQENVGLDCIGYVRWVYYQLTGKDLGCENVSCLWRKLNDPNSGWKEVPLSEVKAGDLAIKGRVEGSELKNGHVAMFLKWENGKNVVIEAGGYGTNIIVIRDKPFLKYIRPPESYIKFNDP